jgi:hypothetical protein
LYCLVHDVPPSLVVRIRPAPATQPWRAPKNWTAVSGGTWNEAPEADQPPAEAVPFPAQLAADEAVADADGDPEWPASAVAVPWPAADPTGADFAGDADVNVAPACPPDVDVDVAQPAVKAATAQSAAAAVMLEVTGFILITFPTTLSRPEWLRRASPL